MADFDSIVSGEYIASDGGRWRPVVGYEGLYIVSDHGDVRAVRKTDRLGRDWPARQLLARINTSGYPSLGLQRDGERKTLRIHRLVAEAFLGNPTKARTQVNHIDGNKLNNHVTNLEWATPAENQLHAYRSLGRKAPRIGMKGSLSPVSKPIVLVCSCCGTTTAHESITNAANHLECTNGTVAGVLRGEHRYAKGHRVFLAEEWHSIASGTTPGDSGT